VTGLTCCGACGYFVYLFIPKMSQSPAEVAQVTHEIVDITIPDDFQPVQSQKVDNFMAASRRCFYRHKEGRGVLVISEVMMKIGDPTSQQQFEQQMSQQPSPVDVKTLDPEKSETRPFSVHAQTVNFTFAEGNDVSSSTRYHEVIGRFTGKTGAATLTVQVEDSVWDEDVVVTMLKSMAGPQPEALADAAQPAEPAAPGGVE